MIKAYTKRKWSKVIRYNTKEENEQYIYMGFVKATENGRYLWSESFGAWRLNKKDAIRDAESMIRRQDYKPKFY